VLVAALQGVPGSGSRAVAAPRCATDAGLLLPPWPAAAPKLKLARPLLLLPGVDMNRSSPLQAAETSLPVGMWLVAAEAAGAAESCALPEGPRSAVAGAGVRAGLAAACLGAAVGVAPAAAKYQGLAAGEMPKLGVWMPSGAALAGRWPGLSALPRLLAVSSLDRGVLPKLLKGVAKSPSEEMQLWNGDAGAGLAKACGGGAGRGA
jgi:hypothetical protein